MPKPIVAIALAAYLLIQLKQITMEKKRITRVTTRSGDQGKSRLATGRLVEKSSHSIRCLGGLDELNSSLGIAVSYITDQNVLKAIAEIQQTLFDAGAMIALEGESEYTERR